MENETSHLLENRGVGRGGLLARRAQPVPDCGNDTLFFCHLLAGFLTPHHPTFFWWEMETEEQKPERVGWAVLGLF